MAAIIIFLLIFYFASFYAISKFSDKVLEWRERFRNRKNKNFHLEKEERDEMTVDEFLQQLKAKAAWQEKEPEAKKHMPIKTINSKIKPNMKTGKKSSNKKITLILICAMLIISIAFVITASTMQGQINQLKQERDAQIESKCAELKSSNDQLTKENDRLNKEYKEIKDAYNRLKNHHSIVIPMDSKGRPVVYSDIDGESSLYYIGNMNTKAYHTPKCGQLPEKSNQLLFLSKQSAENSGFYRCSKCNP